MGSETRHMQKIGSNIIRGLHMCWTISDDSPESNQADLNRCTHPWELLKRPRRERGRGGGGGVKTSEGDKSRERHPPPILAAPRASHVPTHGTHYSNLHMYFRSVNCNALSVFQQNVEVQCRCNRSTRTLKNAFFSRWFIKNGGMAVETQDIME